MRKPNPQKREFRRKQILKAAGTCFAEKGFHQTSTSEICATAGMSQGNLFHYFENKEALIEALIEEERHEIARELDRIRQSEGPLASLLGFLDTSLDLAANPAYVRLAMEISAEALRNPRIRASFVKADAAIRDRLTAILHEAVERGEADKALDFGLAAAWITALSDGALWRAAIDPAFNPASQRPLLHRLLKTLLKAEREA